MVAIGGAVCYAFFVLRASAVALLAVALACSLASCQHPSAEQCDRICWRYNELTYWERFEAEAAKLTPDERAKLRAEREKTWSDMRARTFDPGLENCVRECRRSAAPADVACVEQARTSAQISDCLD